MTTFTVNGQKKTLDVPSEMPLLWVLRDILNLTGTKYGCGVGVCGACSVLVDNSIAVRSCLATCADMEGKNIVTIEGLSSDNSHPLQKAWMELDVPQCGYCQAGQIMNAAALLINNPKPTDEDINESMKDDVCRCGTYQRIREAIHQAAGN
ncbi:MAG: (2Fe-2S)-binding protein [Bacteroidetes bacterium]|nr:(2Fe-2S)-binding protein [Bacteroidota bacterium]